jgi:hypothetical protein
MKKWLLNPFVYVAGSRALLLGVAAMTLTAVIGFYSHAHFDGAVDMHVGKISPLPVYFVEQFINWSTLSILFYVAGKLFSRSSIRFIDVSGTTALARWPTIMVAILAFGIHTPAKSTSPDQLLASITIGTIIFALATLVFLIWMIALLYNAFSVSCNLKGPRATGIFIGTLIAAEILSLFIHSFAFNHLN